MPVPRSSTPSRRHPSQGAIRAITRCIGFLSFVVLGGCASREALGDRSLSILGAGVVNDPANKSLRFDILKFGLDRFCEEMTKAGTPLRMADGEPVLGRFFAESCQSQVLDEEAKKSFVLQYTGKGYAWTNVTGKLGFKSRGLVEYAPDFQLADGALYVYFRPRNVDASAFELLSADGALAGAGIAAVTAAGTTPNEVGKQVVDAALRRGFTVIRYGSDGATDFGLGFVPKGQKPFKPFTISTPDKQVLSNERTEVHAAGQDFVGPITVSDSDQALYLTSQLDGADVLDVQLVAKPVGDAMLDRYARVAGPSQQLAPPLLDVSVQRGGSAQLTVPVAPGQYYFVFDNSGALGRTAPPPGAPGDHAARFDYAILLGPQD